MKFIQLALILQTYLLGLACVTNADRLGYSHHLIGAGAKATGHHPTTSTVIGRNLSEDDEEEKETDDKEEKETDDEEEKEIDDTNQIIDTETMSIFDLVAANEDLSVLGAAVVATGLNGTLAGTGSFTLFAPRDKAFEDVDVDALLADTKALENILKYHVLPIAVYSENLPTPGNETTVTTANGADIVIEVKDNGKVKINEAKVKEVDIMASNGVIHIIDEVLIPPTSSEMNAESTAAAGEGDEKGEGLDEDDEKDDEDKDDEEEEKSKN